MVVLALAPRLAPPPRVLLRAVAPALLRAMLPAPPHTTTIAVRAMLVTATTALLGWAAATTAVEQPPLSLQQRCDSWRCAGY